MKKLWSYFLGAILLFFIIIPLFSSVVISFVANNEITQGLNQFPNWNTFSFENYTMFLDQKIIISITYTVIISLVASILSVETAFVFAFVSSRYGLFGKRLIFATLVCIYSFPSFIHVTSFLDFKYSNNYNISLYYNSAIFIMAFFFFLLPFCFWILNSFFKYVPFSFDRQAAMDNVPTSKLLYGLIRVYLKPALRITKLIVFLICFNDILFSTFLTDRESFRLISHFIFETVYINETMNLYSSLSALGIILSTILLFITAFILRKFYYFLIQENTNNL